MNCFKCNGTGKIRGFEHIENGDCFQCCGTGQLMSKAERRSFFLAREQKRIDRHDARMAREQGVSLEIFRAYVGSGPVPKHPNGCSYSIQEFAAWRAAQ